MPQTFRLGNFRYNYVCARILSKLKHPSITEVFGMCYLGDKSRCLVMELMEGGSLLSTLISLRFQNEVVKKASVPHLLRFLLQIAEGMAFIERKGFIHRDIAARNILLTSSSLEEANAKLGDFGLVKNLYSSNYYTLTDNSSIPVAWSAPEILEGLWKHNDIMVSTTDNGCSEDGYARGITFVSLKTDWHYSVESDVWSYGVLIWEILTYGAQPFAELASAEVIKTVTRLKKVLDPPETQLFPRQLNDLMKQMWAWNKEERPGFADIVVHLKSLQLTETMMSQTQSGGEQNGDLVAQTRLFSPFRSASENVKEMSPFSPMRFRGCLMGALIGCCFASYCNYGYGSLISYVQIEGKVSDWLVDFLSSTADVHYDAHFQLVKCVLDLLLEKKAVDHFATAQKMVETLGKNGVKLGSSETMRTLLNDWGELSSEGEIIELAGKQFDGLGSSGPMGCLRAIPIAMLLCHDIEKAIKDSMYQCRMTHAHPVALANTAFFASGIVNALGAQPYRNLRGNAISDVLSVSNSICSSHDQQFFSEMTKSMMDLLKEPESTPDYFGLVSRKLDTCSWRSQIAAGMFAFFQTCRSQSNNLGNPIMRSLVYAGRNRSHFEVTAVVAGALSGAYFGDQWLSTGLMKRIEDANEIYAGAEQLYRLSLSQRVGL